MFYRYIISNIRTTIEVSAPDDGTAIARIKELLPLVTGAEPYDPRWFLPENTDYRVLYHDR